MACLSKGAEKNDGPVPQCARRWHGSIRRRYSLDAGKVLQHPAQNISLVWQIEIRWHSLVKFHQVRVTFMATCQHVPSLRNEIHLQICPSANIL